MSSTDAQTLQLQSDLGENNCDFFLLEPTIEFPGNIFTSVTFLI